MKGYLLDTDMVIQLLRRSPAVWHKLLQAEEKGIPVWLNALSYYETQRGLLVSGATAQAQRFEQLCRQLGMVQIDLQVLDKAAEIYAQLFRQGTPIEDADILIAAMALVHDLVLVTHNQKHFGRISGIILEDWLSEAQ
ncbi:MAG: tRNA(fMet)-specific endonuclease VapC [Armatimonadota bacterium]|nr:MAG: tRNA(fMet)-specific endonuclease VapC [Armatimonadota bacterium]